jgi:hypothetical protein
MCAAVVGRCRPQPQAKYRFFSVKCVLFNGIVYCVVGENAIQRHDYP